MISKFLNDLNIINYTSGTEYDFKYTKVGDKVKEYMDDILNKNNIYPDEIFSAVQVHSNNIRDTSIDNFKDFAFGKNIDNCDALITTKAKQALVIKYADCTPIILYDKSKKILCAIHSGWRGTVNKISEDVINKLIKEYNSDPSDIYAYIGPSVDSDLYDVGYDVYEAFKDFKFRDEFFKAKNNDKFLLDMKGINKKILLENNIMEDHIHISDKNTLSNEKFHSARREGKIYGLNMTLVMMKD